MDKMKELKIDSTLWATPSMLVNLLDFNLDKISIKTENHGNDIKVHYARYESGGFYLTIMIWMDILILVIILDI